MCTVPSLNANSVKDVKQVVESLCSLVSCLGIELNSKERFIILAFLTKLYLFKVELRPPACLSLHRIHAAPQSK